MKISTAVSALMLSASCAGDAMAFVVTPSSSKRCTALNAKKQNLFAGVAASTLLGLGLSVQVASASSTLEEFSLPSYDSSKGASLIDMSGEVASINKKKVADAKAKREYVDTSAEKVGMDELRKAEKDGSSLLDSLTAQSDVDRKARIEAEKAETRANRWKTF